MFEEMFMCNGHMWLIPEMKKSKNVITFSVTYWEVFKTNKGKGYHFTMTTMTTMSTTMTMT